MTGPSSVSLAVPTRNGARTLERCLESATSQGDDVAVYLFDNASTDASRDIASRYIPGGRIRGTAVNMGAVNNFRRAFDETDGEYFLWLADDDWLGPGFVSGALPVLEADEKATAALPTVTMVDLEGAVLDVQEPNEALTSESTLRRLLGFLDQARWSETYALYRRDRLAAAMPMADCYGGDVVLTWRVLLRGYFCTSPQSVLYYAVDPAKTPAELAETTAAPGRPQQLQWAKARLWRRLWSETGSADVPPAVRRSARAALLLVLPRRTARGHLAEDVREQITRVLPRPGPRRFAQRAVTFLLLPGSFVRAIRNRIRR
jgi:hypothetical protein